MALRCLYFFLLKLSFGTADALSSAAPRLLLHGGDAAQLAPRLGRPAEVVDGLVLFGLALWRRTPPASRS